MLNGKQKRFLRAIAHNLKPVYQIGKDNIHDNLLAGIDKSLEANELIKVKILESCELTKNEAALIISSKTKAEIVQILGRTIVFYRDSPEKIYKLP